MDFNIAKTLISFPEKGGWRKELNRVSWNGRAPVFDIRGWDDSHTRMTKGTTLTDEEARLLVDNINILREELGYADQCDI